MYHGEMQVVFPDVETRARVDNGGGPMSEADFFDFCAQNSDLRIERDATGEIIIMPPTGWETGYRNSDLTMQLAAWSKRDGRGRAFDSNAEYLLPNGAARSPDASWVLKLRIDRLTMEEKRRFAPLCPDFVVELTSPSDRLRNVKAKMREWMENGASLGWLIDADSRTVYVYRPGQDPEELVNVDHVAGEGPVDGFRLELGDIWEGL
jgi:Uma2 family endonuclease